MGVEAKEMLETLLGHLGFVAQVEETIDEHGVHLQIYCPEKDRLIGDDGITIDDLQLLLNRMVLAADSDAPRVHVDVEHYRTMRDDALVRRVREVAEQVRQSGIPLQLDPMNSYDRRVVHNAFKDDPQIATLSPEEGGRMKRITLSPRK
jgi:spoIIIJ-associated protein